MWIKTAAGKMVNLANFKGISLFPSGRTRAVYAYSEVVPALSKDAVKPHPNIDSIVFLTDQIEADEAERFVDRLNLALGGLSFEAFLDPKSP